jgi:hypothetical protein
MLIEQREGRLRLPHFLPPDYYVATRPATARP